MRDELTIRYTIVAQDGLRSQNIHMDAPNVRIFILLVEISRCLISDCIKLAICKIPCKNNGKCVKPEFCTCPTGYTGRHCEWDVNECETEKPCDQTCYNTEGSYYCTCRLGFILQPDRQSCKKIDTSFGNDDIGTAFEARDLENDVDTDDMDSRINNIEKVCAKNTINTIPLCIANNGKPNKK